MRAALVTALLLAAAAARADEPPRVAAERIVLHTTAGDIVLALYPDVAPRHVEQLVHLARLGVYDTTHFYRVEPGFVIQISTALDRKEPLSTEQRAAIHPLAAEFSALRHRRGVLSMARQDNDPDSGETSFSILLGDAPHLDGTYTVFGHVESGMDVVDEICKVPRNPKHQPLTRVSVERAEVVEASALAALRLEGPKPVAVPEALLPSAAGSRTELAGGVAVMVLGGLACFFLARRLPGRVLLSLNLVVVLVGGFLLFVLLFPAAQGHAWLAPALFAGVLGLFRLMSQFESAP
jgi:cyclophilin family peptidyl-prolyl cis-trans isomerase